MIHTRFSRILSTTAFLAALVTLSACSTMESAYNDTYDNVSSVFDGDGDDLDAAPKVSVKSPAAAPVQDVNANEINNDGEQPVELGSMSDKAVPTAAIAPAPAPAPAASDSVALLTLRFNQPHVHYEDALSQAVNAAEQVKQGVQYEVLSTVPDLSSLPPEQQEKLAARAKDNLRNVVMKMQQQGVAPDRIRIAEQTLRIRSQEIRVFVR
ncbi:MAG: hypothetical protein SFX19_02515 [Alphaproteobacteria bacterium]|nr:hypothetical protein [Alphaproteobacteria bacterium]